MTRLRGTILHARHKVPALLKRLPDSLKKKKSKFGNTRVYLDPKTNTFLDKKLPDCLCFDSKREATRWLELLMLKRAGHIDTLTRQDTYRLDVNGVHICKYIADFKYFDKTKKIWVVEDTKGFRTREYVVKNKLMRAIHGIKIVEI